MSMGRRILILGGGGREHALAWRMARDQSAGELFAWPGNPGISRFAMRADLPVGSGPEEIAGWAERRKIDLVVIGPERFLFDGVADKLRERGAPVFGPSRRAARVEESKSFAKELMARCHVPTAGHLVFTSIEEARRYVDVARLPVVVKADGPAAGKGVVIADTAAEALRAVEEFFALGGRVVIEDFLEGEEASIFALTDGLTCLLLPAAHDHKRAWEGGLGPNTGGMGAVAPSSRVTEGMLDRVRKSIINPVLGTLAAEGTPFVGTLYVGLMITEAGPFVLEFNARLGDPETQAVLPLLEGDFAEVIHACATGSLAELNLESPRAKRANLHFSEGRWSAEGRVAATVVLASNGYPGAFQTGKPISGLEEAEAAGAIVFHAGTRNSRQIVTSGGRVLDVTAVASSLEEALRQAYGAAELIRFEGKYFRRDIGRAFA